LTIAWAFTGVISALYDMASWSELDTALLRAKAGQGSKLLKLADEYYGRNKAGYAGNENIANMAVNCLDFGGSNTSAAQTAKARQAAAAESAVLGPYWVGNGINVCAYWPGRAKHDTHKVRSTTKAKILLVGTTGDPATPYGQAQAVAKQLKTGRLLTYVGEGHTAYRADNTCIAKAVDNYLISGKLPPKGKRC
jgi:hypothetical protein